MRNFVILKNSVQIQIINQEEKLLENVILLEKLIIHFQSKIHLYMMGKYKEKKKPYIISQLLYIKIIQLLNQMEQKMDLYYIELIRYKKKIGIKFVQKLLIKEQHNFHLKKRAFILWLFEDLKFQRYNSKFLLFRID